MSPQLPDFVRGCDRADVASQVIEWSALRGPWPEALQPYPALRADLEREVVDHNGIRREFVFDRADGRPVELFLAAMAWGFGPTTVRWPKQAGSPKLGGCVRPGLARCFGRQMVRV
jgi:hypothetical protein